MMKEIHEQPKAVQDTLSSVIKNNCIDLSSSVEITEGVIIFYVLRHYFGSRNLEVRVKKSEIPLRY